MGGVAVLAQELLVWAAEGLLWTVAPRPSHPERSGTVGRVTFLLHGYLAPPTILAPLARHLRPRIEGDLLIWTYLGERDVPRLAAQLGAFIERVHPAGRVDLVGHSLGGLVARYWAQELGGAARVDRLVTLGTPHQGTTSARLVPGLGSLAPGSPFLRGLAERADALQSVQVTTIAARQDLMVRPSHHALLERGRCHHLEGLGHNGLLFSPRVWRLVAEALSR